MLVWIRVGQKGNTISLKGSGSGDMADNLCLKNAVTPEIQTERLWRRALNEAAVRCVIRPLSCMAWSRVNLVSVLSMKSAYAGKPVPGTPLPLENIKTACIPRAF